MQARRIARELALLSISQLPSKPQKLAEQDLTAILVASIRTLASETHDTLETAAAELEQSRKRILNSESRERVLSNETRVTDVDKAREMVSDAIDLAQTAINRVGAALELPEFIQLANQQEVRAFALEILSNLSVNRTDIDQRLTLALVDWQLPRLAVIDRHILQVAVTEMVYLKQPGQIAINEAVELAKRYSGEDGYRFINGVLRRVLENLRSASAQSPSSI
jgi:transcription antitermination protein NusB